MLQKKINKLYIHLISTSKKKTNLKQLRITYNNITKKKYFFLFFTHLSLIFKTWEFSSYLFSFNYHIKHNDYALIQRELFILIMTWIKLILFCNTINISTQKQKISILRSPFVYSKTKEQFEIRYLKILINFLNFSNILLYNYFLLLNLYFGHYCLFKISKCFK